ncbi:MAG: DUF3828 domain-containing protein [Alphaproteobacteria bacterium]
MKWAVAGLAALALLGACKKPAGPSAPVAATMADADEAAQTQAGAEAFVNRIYREFQGYANAAPESMPKPLEQARIYDKSMLDLLAQSERLAAGNLGAWEADPLCACQDPAGMTSQIEMKGQSGATATATVRLGFGPKVWQDLTLDLVYEDGHWRVHDIESGDLPSARETLIHYNKEMGEPGKKP